MTDQKRAAADRAARTTSAHNKDARKKEDAQRYLSLIDPNAPAHTFQVFDDDQQRKDKSRAAIFHGTLEKYVRLSGCPRFNTLADAFAEGCGIFLTINETDGTGR